MHAILIMLLILVSLVIQLFQKGDSVCTHLPSHSCFVDCTRTDSPNLRYTVVCENVDGNQLQADLQMFAGLNATFKLHIWNSPAIERLGGASFLDVQDLLVDIEMQNVINLQIFPEVKALTGLTLLTIRNAPKLNYFPLELLPPSIEEITLFRTGIQEFSSDHTRTSDFPNLTFFRIHFQTIRFLDQYFMAFPNIDTIEIVECSVNIGKLESQPLPFLTRKPLKRLRISNNAFEGRGPRAYLEVFDHILNSITVNENSDIEISGNEFPIGKKTIKNFNRLSPVRRLSLRKSYFENYVTLENLFASFTNLQTLDLGETNLPTFKLGIFRGLPNLEILKLDGNGIRGMEERDFFVGLEAKNLSVLDLSNNHIEGSPMGFERWGTNLVYCDLSGNQIDRPVFGNKTEYFGKLKYVSQARNQKIVLVSSIYGKIESLQTIDSSCNLYRNITKSFFNELPPTLKILNITFCGKKESQRPLVADDAFSEFPTIKELYFNGAFLRSHIFKKLKRMPEKSAQALLVLHVAYNKIAYLNNKGAHFTPFNGLEELSLKGNRMQSTGSEAFKPLINLRKLNLANNALFSIGPKDFIGLDRLEYLDLSGNKLLLIAEGALDMLPNLLGLFVHDNTLTESSLPLTIFGAGKGMNLTHISVENLHIQCLNPIMYTRFPKLKWIYLNGSIPLFADMDPKLDVMEQIKRTPLHPWAGLTMCQNTETVQTYANLDENFVRIQINDPNSAVYQSLYLHFISCLEDKFRNIREMVENILCTS